MQSKGPAFQFETNDTAFAEGVQVYVFGRVEETNGLAIIRPEYYETPNYYTSYDFYIEDTNRLPAAPTNLTIEAILADPERYESSLIVITNIYMQGTDTLWPFGGDTFLTSITNASGNALRLFIDKDTDIPGQLAPTGSFHITGILLQYDTSLPATNGYQFMPCGYADLAMNIGPSDPVVALASTVFSARAGRELSFDVVGQDLNADDTLTLTMAGAPATAGFSNISARVGRFCWTPALSDAGVTNMIEFSVSDDMSTSRIDVAIAVAPCGVCLDQRSALRQ